MPTIGIWVDEETKKKWEILNKHPDRIGTKGLKEALDRLLEEYGWWIDTYERFEEHIFDIRKEREIMDEVEVTQSEVLSEI